MKRRLVCLLAGLILLACCVAQSALSNGDGAEELSPRGFVIEENTAFQPWLYPYVVRTESADWYIAQDDLDLMGEDALYTGLSLVLRDQEADFADARAALASVLNEEVPKVTICTDFTGKAGISEISFAYYNAESNFIKVFHNWDQVRAELLHEYVHYLTFACCEPAITSGFWGEGVAEYVSRIVCVNRMSSSVNMTLSEEDIEFFRGKGVWDAERDCVDERVFTFGMAQLYCSGAMIGQPYFAVCHENVTRTEYMQNDPQPGLLSFSEVASMTAWLAETRGMEFISENWQVDENGMERLFGKSFSAFYDEWAVWNALRCTELGLGIVS